MTIGDAYARPIVDACAETGSIALVGAPVPADAGRVESQHRARADERDGIARAAERACWRRADCAGSWT